jgi:hypothetical protein
MTDERTGGYRIFRIEETADGKLHTYAVISEQYHAVVTNHYVETKDGTLLYINTTIEGDPFQPEHLIWLQEAIGMAIRQIGDTP